MTIALLTRGIVSIGGGPGGGVAVSIDRTLDPVLSAVELKPRIYAADDLRPKIPQLEVSQEEDLVPKIISAEELVPRVYDSTDLRPRIVSVEEEE